LLRVDPVREPIVMTRTNQSTRDGFAWAVALHAR
jgi:hypothetical protein